MKVRTMMAMAALLIGCGNGAGSDNEVSAQINADNSANPEQIPSSNNASPQDNAEVVASDDCEMLCASKGAECQAPANILAAACVELCGGGPTHDQLDCLESSPCADLGEAFEGGGICGLGEPPPPPTNSTIGDECSCDPNPDTQIDEFYGYCEGGGRCDQLADPIEGCLHRERTGVGECVSLCDSENEGSQGRCPTGQVCADSGKGDGGANYFVCTS